MTETCSCAPSSVKDGSNRLAQPLKWWGGKHYLAKKIIELMPRHLHYVEPYAGGLAVLLGLLVRICG